MSKINIIKSIYELTAQESKIVNKAIKLLLKMINFPTHIHSIQVAFTCDDYHKVLEEYTTVKINEILLKTDLGTFIISIYSDYTGIDRFSRYLMVEGKETFVNHEPELSYFSKTYSFNAETYAFVLKWVEPKKPLLERFKRGIINAPKWFLC